MRLGIDIGGTTISIGLVKDGSIVSRTTEPSFSPDATLEQTEEHLCAIIDKMISPEVESIGIGVPSVVDTVNGIVYDAVNIPSWQEVHLKSLLEKRYGVPAYVNNDANCYAIGATGVLGCPENEILVGVTLGTGVGVGVVVGGKILNGSNTGVGELTWFPYNGKPIEQSCSKEFFLSRGWEPCDIAQRADEGDSVAKELFAEYARNLAIVVLLVISAYDPDHIVFGGGLANCSRHFDAVLKEELFKQFPFPESIKKLRLSYLPQSEIAVMGASLLK